MSTQSSRPIETRVSRSADGPRAADGINALAVEVEGARRSLESAVRRRRKVVDASGDVELRPQSDVDDVWADAGSGAVAVYFPDAAQSEGRVITVKKVDASANPVAIVPRNGLAEHPTLGTLLNIVSWTVPRASYTYLCHAGAWRIM